jgi:hypothetical protein
MISTELIKRTANKLDSKKTGFFKAILNKSTKSEPVSFLLPAEVLLSALLATLLFIYISIGIFL